MEFPLYPKEDDAREQDRADALAFPGGTVTVSNDRIERKLREFLDGPGRRCDVSLVKGEWHCALRLGPEAYMASSRLSMHDAIANALQIAQGREECDPELT